MEVIELVGRPGTGKTTLARKLCRWSNHVISRATFFSEELNRGRIFRWFPRALLELPHLEDYITNRTGERFGCDLQGDPALLEAISLILGEVTRFERLQPRLNLLFRDYVIHKLAQQSASDAMLLLDEGLTHRVGTFSLNGVSLPTLQRVAALLPLADHYAYIEVPDHTTRHRLISRSKNDSLYIPRDVYQALKADLEQRDAQFVDLSITDPTKVNLDRLLQAHQASLRPRSASGAGHELPRFAPKAEMDRMDV